MIEPCMPMDTHAGLVLPWRQPSVASGLRRIAANCEVECGHHQPGVGEQANPVDRL
jgi:hypothetical protein